MFAFSGRERNYTAFAAVSIDHFHKKSRKMPQRESDRSSEELTLGERRERKVTIHLLSTIQVSKSRVLHTAGATTGQFVGAE